MIKLAAPYRKSRDDDTHNFLHVDGHLQAARYVRKMTYQSCQSDKLRRMEHILVYAPVYESFAKQLVQMIDSNGRTLIENLSEIEEFVDECGIRDVLRLNENAETQIKIEKLEEELEYLKTQLK